MSEVPQQLVGSALAHFGFVRVDGLPCRRGDREWIIAADENQLGCHDHNNGMDVAITLTGEVWLRATPEGDVPNGWFRAVKTLCPNEGNAFVPCSNGEAVPSHILLKRFSNPCWQYQVPGASHTALNPDGERVW